MDIISTAIRKLRSIPTAVYVALVVGLAMLFASPELYAGAASGGISRVTDALNETKTEIEKWYVSLSAIASVAFTILGTIVGVQWWEERGRGKESAKGLIMGAFFAFAIMPWILNLARGCGGSTP